MKPQSVLSALAAALFATGIASAASSNVTPQGAAWLSYAVSDSNGEVLSCKMAEQKSTNASVKSFCQKMIADHSKMSTQGTQLAQQLGVTVKQSPPASEVKDQQQLQSLSGTAFDQKFMQIQVSDHKKDIAKTQRAISAMQDPKLKSFAQKGLAKLDTHLKLAESTQSQVH